MSVKKLLRMGESSLLKKSLPVDSIVNLDQSILDDLRDSMTYYGGVGIAAPQIGYFLKILMLEVDHNARYPNEESIPLTILINPEIQVLDTAEELGWEGCLSVPGYRGLVPRYKRIYYTGFTPEGNKIEREASGFHARVVQHEYDHLNGILYPMRMKDMSTFGCEDILWEQMTGTTYPDEYRQKLIDHWS